MCRVALRKSDNWIVVGADDRHRDRLFYRPVCRRYVQRVVAGLSLRQRFDIRGPVVERVGPVAVGRKRKRAVGGRPTSRQPFGEACVGGGKRESAASRRWFAGMRVAWVPFFHGVGRCTAATRG